MGSLYQWQELHFVTARSIEQQPRKRSAVNGEVTSVCGCMETPAGKWWVCTYHDGMEEGAWAVQETLDDLDA